MGKFFIAVVLGLLTGSMKAVFLKALAPLKEPPTVEAAEEGAVAVEAGSALLERFRFPVFGLEVRAKCNCASNTQGHADNDILGHFRHFGTFWDILGHSGTF